jgi:L-threonylcarbamoyladenylate synthase
MQIELPEQVQQQIEKGIEIIRKGGVIAFPTDTVYGLGGGVYIESAIQRIFQVKQRPTEMALPILLADAAQIHEVAMEIPAYGWRLIKEFLPGGLTLVVYRSKVVKDIITGGGDTVAIRIPDHPVPRALIRGCGMPIIGTSANVSGKPPILSAEDVKKEIGDSVDLIIDGLPMPSGMESTVVDVTGEVPVILRVGAIPRAAIEKVVEVV